MFEKFGVDVSLAECRIVKNLAMKWNGAFNTFKNEHFEGAIHSVHHSLVPVESHGHDVGHGHDSEGRQAPAGATDEGCPVAAAALHLAATTTEAPPVLGALSPVADLVTLGTPDGPRIIWREPAHGRAPPSFRSLPS